MTDEVYVSQFLHSATLAKIFSSQHYEDWVGRVNGWVSAASKIDTKTIWLPGEIRFWLQILICLLLILPYRCIFIFRGLIIKVKKRNFWATDIKNTWKSCACGLFCFVCFFYYPLNKCMHDKNFACVKMKLKLSRTEQ